MDFQATARRVSLRWKLLAEFVGTGLMIFLGLSPSARDKLELGSVNPTYEAFGWWFAITISIILTDRISGAHLNPSVSFSMVLSSKLGFINVTISWRHMFYYGLAQTFGAMLAACLLYMSYYYSLKDNYTISTMGIFVTEMQPDIEIWQAVLCEIFSTAILLMCILSITEAKNGVAKNIVAKAVVIGSLVFILNVSFNGISGPCMNAARDIGPRIICSLFGWKSKPFTYKNNNWYFLVTTFAPFVGSALGTFVYYGLIKKAFTIVDNYEQSLLLNNYTEDDDAFKFHSLTMRNLSKNDEALDKIEDVSTNEENSNKTEETQK